MLMDVEMMTNTGLEFMRMIIHPWLSEQHTPYPSICYTLIALSYSSLFIDGIPTLLVLKHSSI